MYNKKEWLNWLHLEKTKERERDQAREKENMHINKGYAGQEISKHMYKLNLEQIKTKYPLFNTMVHMNA